MSKSRLNKLQREISFIFGCLVKYFKMSKQQLDYFACDIA